MQEVAETDLTPHDWCRMAVIDRLDHEYGFSKKERLLFQQIVRIQFFVAFGFQMLADNSDNCRVEEASGLRKRKGRLPCQTSGGGLPVTDGAQRAKVTELKHRRFEAGYRDLGRS